MLEALQQRYPHPRTHLDAQNAWELLVATVLAAQCTDARVNTVTPELFRRWPTPAAQAEFDRYKKCERIYARCYYNGTPIRRLTVAA